MPIVNVESNIQYTVKEVVSNTLSAGHTHNGSGFYYDNKFGFVATNNNIYRTVDGGLTWSNIKTQTHNIGKFICRGDSYILATNYSDNGITITSSGFTAADVFGASSGTSFKNLVFINYGVSYVNRDSKLYQYHGRTSPLLLSNRTITSFATNGGKSIAIYDPVNLAVFVTHDKFQTEQSGKSFTMTNYRLAHVGTSGNGYIVVPTVGAATAYVNLIPTTQVTRTFPQIETISDWYFETDQTTGQVTKAYFLTKAGRFYVDHGDGPILVHSPTARFREYSFSITKSGDIVYCYVNTSDQIVTVTISQTTFTTGESKPKSFEFDIVSGINTYNRTSLTGDQFTQYYDNEYSIYGGPESKRWYLNWNHWYQIKNDIGLDTIAPSAYNNAYAFGLKGNDFYFSTDNGVTWKFVKSYTEKPILAVSSNTTGGIYYNNYPVLILSNQTETFNPFDPTNFPPDISSVTKTDVPTLYDVVLRDEYIYYLDTTNNQVMKVTHLRNNTTTSYNLPFPTHIIRIKHTTLYIGSTDGRVAFSTNDGATWTQYPAIGEAGNTTPFDVNFTGGKVGAIVNNKLFVLDTNDVWHEYTGASFTGKVLMRGNKFHPIAQTTDGDWYEIDRLPPNNDISTFVTGPASITTQIKTNQFEYHTNPFPETMVHLDYRNQAIFALSNTNKLYRSKDSGNSWELIHTLPNTYPASKIIVTSDTLVCVVPDKGTTDNIKFIEYHTNTWNEYSITINGDTVGVFDSLDNINYRAFSDTGNYYKIVYTGQGNFTSTSHGIRSPIPDKLISVTTTLQYYYYLNAVFRSTDDNNWSNMNYPSTTAITIFYADENILVAGDATQAYYSHDQGNTWHSVDIDFSTYPANGVSFDGPIGIFLCQNAKFVSYDVGKTWSLYNTLGGSEINN